MSQKITAVIAGDVVLNAVRQNFRYRDAWKIGAVFLVCWRSFWIAWNPTTPLSPQAWAVFLRVDLSVFLLVALAAGWWSMRGESVVRSETIACLYWMNLTGMLLPTLAFLILAVTGMAEKLGIDAGGALPVIIRHSGAGEVTRSVAIVLVGTLGAHAAHAVKRSRAH